MAYRRTRKPHVWLTIAACVTVAAMPLHIAALLGTPIPSAVTRRGR